MAASLYRDVIMVPQPSNLILSVSEKDVSTRLGLELPWRHQDDVTVSDPNTAFHFSSDSAESFFAVLALHHNSFASKHLHGYA